MSTLSPTYRAWKQLSGRPGGSLMFSAAAMVRVPYFASVLPRVVTMEPGYAEVAVPKWFFVYNHLHTVHAIASCNAAEAAMGMAMEATVPTSHRWIHKAMNVQYLAKATTSLRSESVTATVRAPIHHTPRCVSGSTCTFSSNECARRPARRSCWAIALAYAR